MRCVWSGRSTPSCSYDASAASSEVVSVENAETKPDALAGNQRFQGFQNQPLAALARLGT